MVTTLQKEFVEFSKCHKNVYNSVFHVICGFLFMTFLFLLSRTYNHVLLILYSVLLLLTIQNLALSFTIFAILFLLLRLIRQYKLKKNVLFSLFLVFYLAPDLSHYLTNEPSMLQINNITPLSLFTNIFYLLPFSMQCLSNSKQLIS
jgi:hypothetical protein